MQMISCTRTPGEWPGHSCTAQVPSARAEPLTAGLARPLYVLKTDLCWLGGGELVQGMQETRTGRGARCLPRCVRLQRLSGGRVAYAWLSLLEVGPADRLPAEHMADCMAQAGLCATAALCPYAALLAVTSLQAQLQFIPQ